MIMMIKWCNEGDNDNDDINEVMKWENVMIKIVMKMYENDNDNEW